MNMMKNWLQHLPQYLFYGGLTKEQYHKIARDIDESNRKSLIILSTACVFVYFLRLCVSYTNVPFGNKLVFTGAIALFGLLALLNWQSRGKRWLIHLSADIFMASYLGVGILTAIGVNSIEERTTLFLVFLVAGPMLFAHNALELSAVIIPAEIIYLILISRYQAAYPVYRVNVSNSLFFAVTGLLLGIYMSNMKVSGIYHAFENLQMEEVNALNEKLEKSQTDLQIALSAAERANRAKTTFLNNMSHDIRTPMNAIIGFTSLAATHIDNKEQVRDYLEKIMTSSQHLLSLINDVLDMSRIESGKVKIEATPVHLPDALHDLRTIIQASVTARQLDLFIDTEDVHNEDIIADKLRLNQVLLNILSNAIKFTKPGGTVALRVIEKEGAPHGYADFEFRVKDNGIGMSQEFQKHIFEAFSREDSSTVNGIQGTGLGMAITKNIVYLMNGTITVNSTLGKGSEFIVNLRFEISGEAVHYETIDELQGTRALVADDDTDCCLSMSRMLREIGMRPEWTISGKEAVIRAKDALEQGDEFGVYIIDWLMPDMNGIETVRRIRRIIGDSKPIIILTAYDWTDIEEEAREAGVTAFCTKPIFMSELRDILTRPFKVPSVEHTQAHDFTGKHVLLVEDNALNQEIAEAILLENGFLVDVADDGVMAVEKMQSSPAGHYDLVLMDVQMPRMNGYDATRQIRALADPVKANIPIIAMTANAFAEDKLLAEEAGMNGHLAKPIEIPTLMDMLHTILK